VGKRKGLSARRGGSPAYKMSKLYTTNIKSEDKRDLLTDNFVPEDLKMMAKSTQLLLLLAASWLTLNQAAPAPLGTNNC